MAREEIVIEEIVIQSWRFTTLSAFIRELEHLLSFSDYRIEAHVRDNELERLRLELEAWRGFLRLKVKVKADDQTEQKGESAGKDGARVGCGSTAGNRNLSRP